MQEEVSKVQSGVQLDLNLEKGRLKEEVGACTLTHTHTNYHLPLHPHTQSTNLAQGIKDTHNRIDTEV